MPDPLMDPVTAFLKYKKASNGPPTPGSVPVTTDASGNVVDPMTLPLLQALPAWNTNQNISMHVYFSTSPIGDVFGVVKRKNWGQEEVGGFPHWTWDNIEFGNWNYELRKDVEIEIPMVRRYAYSCSPTQLLTGRSTQHVFAMGGRILNKRRR